MSKSLYLAVLVAAPLIVSGVYFVERPKPQPSPRIPKMIRIETMPMPPAMEIRFYVTPVKPYDRRKIEDSGPVIVEQVPLKRRR